MASRPSEATAPARAARLREPAGQSDAPEPPHGREPAGLPGPPSPHAPAAPHGLAGPHGLAEDEISLAAVGALLLQGRRVIAVAAAVAAAAGVLAARLPAPRYQATASFVPQEAGQPSLGGLGGLASQFGVQIPGSGGTEGPQFYQELLSAREILTPILLASYAAGGSASEGGAGSPRTLLDVGEVSGATESERLDRGLEWLRNGIISSSVGRETNIVTFSVTTRWPEVSRDVAASLLAGIQKFNLDTRQTQAQAEREFLQRRVAEAREDLLSAEDSLQRFLQQNRRFDESPELIFRHDRLQRQVTMRQQVFTGLMEAYEQARIQEVRNTPVVTVLEEPVLPAMREPRGTVLKTLLGLILGGMAGVFWVFVRQATSARDDPDALALHEAWAETKADLRRLVPGRRG